MWQHYTINQYSFTKLQLLNYQSHDIWQKLDHICRKQTQNYFPSNTVWSVSNVWLPSWSLSLSSFIMFVGFLFLFLLSLLAQYSSAFEWTYCTHTTTTCIDPAWRCVCMYWPSRHSSQTVAAKVGNRDFTPGWDGDQFWRNLRCLLVTDIVNINTTCLCSISNWIRTSTALLTQTLLFEHIKINSALIVF